LRSSMDGLFSAMVFPLVILGLLSWVARLSVV
jgi:hypothetical protein